MKQAFFLCVGSGSLFCPSFLGFADLGKIGEFVFTEYFSKFGIKKVYIFSRIFEFSGACSAATFPSIENKKAWLVLIGRVGRNLPPPPVYVLSS